MAEKTIGTIYPAAEAESRFGSVHYSIEIGTEELKSFLNRTNNLLMFNIKDEKLYILGDGRESVYPAGFAPEQSEVYTVYSKSKIEELINEGKADRTIIEQRKDVLSVTNGIYTLENSSWCPPFCS